jgi:hypothetical protein
MLSFVRSDNTHSVQEIVAFSKPTFNSLISIRRQAVKNNFRYWGICLHYIDDFFKQLINGK